MNHLSAEKISAILIGDGSPADLRHAHDCAECGGEVERLSRALGIFRDAVRRFSYQARPLFAPLQAGSSRGREAAAAAWSFVFHGAAIAGILVIGTLRPVQSVVEKTVVQLWAPNLKPYLPKKDPAHGGGGGGTRSPLEASEGKLPKIAPRQFVPPQVDPPDKAKLVMAPTIVADAQILNVNTPNLGDPLSHLGIPSNGSGCCAGIGNGDGTGVGVGVGHGPGVGPGAGGGFDGGAFRIGGGVTSPVVITKVEPDYSEDARKARFQGIVKLECVVDEHGMPRQMRIVRALGLGLDEKAMEAVAKWRFKPGTKNGKPVAVIAVIEVTFRLL